MVEVWLPYGNTEVCVRVPTKNLIDLKINDKLGVEHPNDEIENALMNPFGTKRLNETVKSGDRVAIVIKDSDASTNRIVVSAFLKELDSAGVKYENVSVIAAQDPLRTSSVKAETPLLDEEPFTEVRVLIHDCDKSEHLHVGKTSRGTEVHLNKEFVEADVKIVAATVEPHPFAGYSGGRECVLLGVSNLQTVQQNLALSLDRKAKRGILQDNPVHEDMVEAAHLAGVDLSLGLVRNSRREVVKAFAGEHNRALEEAVRLVEEMYRVPTESRADVVFVSPGGAPFDTDLFEACKSMDAALEVVKRGKVIVLVAECMDGYGNMDFYGAMSMFKDPKKLEKSLKRRFTTGGLVAYRLMTSLKNAKIVLVSSMPDYYVSQLFGMQSMRTANEAFQYANKVVGNNGKITCIPYGNLIMPSVKTE